MRFLKVSIVILFLLSLLTAGITFYLSTIRENEKEKRVYLEGVNVKLEEQVSTLEFEKSQLQRKASNLEVQKKELSKKLKDESEAHKYTQAMIREKDLQMEGVREEAKEAAKAFENAKNRNRELERILDELEARMKQLETQNTLPTSETGYVQVSINPVSPSSVHTANAPDTANPPEAPSATQAAPSVPAPKKAELSSPTPVTTLPEPPKRRKFLSFFQSADRKKAASSAHISIPKPSVKPAQVQTFPEPVAQVSTEKKPAPPEESKPKVIPPRKADQTIAAGSVLLVNRRYNFLVINLGSRQGLALDDVLTVQRGSVEIAKARVEKLYDDYCAAYIIEEQSEHPIGEGDVVTAA